jgi:large subunit ribosomal protein L17
MRHARAGKKLGRDSAHRKALYANLAGALIEHGRIKTTVTKAKAVKPIAEQMITLGRRGDLHARRQAVAFLRSKDVVHKLFAEVAPRYANRPGGYSRIVKLGPRPGDAAEMAYLELVDEPVASAPVADDAPAGAETSRRRLRRGGAATAAPAPAAEEAPETEEELVEDPAAEADDAAAEHPVDDTTPVAETPADAADEAEPTGESQAVEPDQQP